METHMRDWTHRTGRIAAAMAGTLLFISSGTALAGGAGAPAKGVPWRIQGDLTEACSCSVPCSCNFGEAPSPHSFCYALFSLDIRKGNYGKVKLNGLRTAGALGEKGMVAYLDERATPEQSEALKAIWQQIGETAQAANAAPPGGPPAPEIPFLGFKTARIEQEVGTRSHRLKIGDQGGFEGDYIVGLDGKTPVVVENNWSWNIRHGIKAKAKKVTYKDDFGNELDFSDTNANQGQFDWSDKTPIYFR
jgi:hypothetical protein